MGFFQVCPCVQKKKKDKVFSESYKPVDQIDERASELDSEILNRTEEGLQHRVDIYDKISPASSRAKTPETSEGTLTEIGSHRDVREPSQDDSIQAEHCAEQEEDTASDKIIEIRTENLNHLCEVQKVVMDRGAQLAELENKLDVLVGAKENIIQQLENIEGK